MNTTSFQSNISRVRNIVSLYQKSTKGRKGVHDTDILRAALIFLHATMEEILRELLISSIDLTKSDAIDKYPLLGEDKQHPEKFKLGALVRHKGKTVEELIKQSVLDHLQRYSSFNNIGDIQDALSKCGIRKIDNTSNRFKPLQKMIERRHNIVHKADRNDSPGKGNHKTKSISKNAIEAYINSVISLQEHINNGGM